MEDFCGQKGSPRIDGANYSQNSAQWLESELNRRHISATKQSDGVYFCIADSMFVALILLDRCLNPAYLQGGFLCALPHCLIAERPVYSNTVGSAISHISEFTSGAKNLTKEIKKCILQFKKAKIANPFACVVPQPPHSLPMSITIGRFFRDLRPAFAQMA
jgi:hypothetical protein